MILDTSFLVDVLRGEEATHDWVDFLDEEGLGVVTAISVMELWEGIHLTDATASEREAVEALLSGLHHADFDRPSAMRSGRTSVELSREGQSAQVEDVMIAAIATELGQPVLTRNVADFERLPDVAVDTY